MPLKVAVGAPVRSFGFALDRSARPRAAGATARAVNGVRALSGLPDVPCLVCCTRHVARCTWHDSCCTRHVARYTWHAARCMRHVIRGMLHIACGTLHVARCTLHRTACRVPVGVHRGQDGPSGLLLRRRNALPCAPTQCPEYPNDRPTTIEYSRLRGVPAGVPIGWPYCFRAGAHARERSERRRAAELRRTCAGGRVWVGLPWAMGSQRRWPTAARQPCCACAACSRRVRTWGPVAPCGAALETIVGTLIRTVSCPRCR